MRAAILVLLCAAVATAAPKPKPGALVLVIDRSGSMQGAKLDAAKAAALAAFDALGAGDRIAVVTFDSEAKLWIPLAGTSDRKFIKTELDRIQAGGGTNIYPALKLAFETLKPLKAGHRHIILFTDGEAPSDGIAELLSDMRASNITASAVGVGDADRNLLAMIADAGEGRLYLIDDISALPKVFAKEVAAAMR